MGYLTRVGDEQIEVDNQVGLALIEQYKERFPDDEHYVLSNANAIKSLDIAACLLKWFNLDSEGQRIFAKYLGMPMDLLSDTCEGIKWIYNH